jgi:hypothetical protein
LRAELLDRLGDQVNVVALDPVGRTIASSIFAARACASVTRRRRRH